MKYEQLMSEYGASINMSDMEVDPAGAVFEFDGTSVVVRPNADGDRILIMAVIGSIPEARQNQVASKLLQLSFATAVNDGMAFAAGGENYYCMNSLLLAGLDAAAFENELISLSRKVDAARNLLDLERQAASVEERHEREAAQAGGAFIQA
ncbi:type III secretion system chaperone [Roseibium sp.]|uniref:type III secretion system chaperone n=1 Tax=Roseibium sp. TaxID=1936156 RepID=UPI003267F10D